MMMSTGSESIRARFDRHKFQSNYSLIFLSARPSASTLMRLLLMLLLFWMCLTVVQSADNFVAVSDAVPAPSYLPTFVPSPSHNTGIDTHSHYNNSNSFDMHYDNFAELTASNDTRILRRGKRYLEFTKGSRMSWRTNGKNNMPGLNNLIAYGYGFRANYPFPDQKDQRKSNRVFFKRDLFSKLETALDGHGFDGRACLLKSFCTAIYDVDRPQQKSGMLFKLLKLIFKIEDHEKHHVPYLKEDNCQQILHSHCPLSFDSISPFTDDV